MFSEISGRMHELRTELPTQVCDWMMILHEYCSHTGTIGILFNDKGNGEIRKSQDMGLCHCRYELLKGLLGLLSPTKLVLAQQHCQWSNNVSIILDKAPVKSSEVQETPKSFYRI